MLTRWTLENFKPFQGPVDIPLAPVTAFAGLNSSGKSSILQSILAIAQTLRHQSMDRPLVLNGSLIQLGTFSHVHNDRTSDDFLRIGFEMALNNQRKVHSLTAFTGADDHNPTRVGLQDTSLILSLPDKEKTLEACWLSPQERARAKAVMPFGERVPLLEVTEIGHANPDRPTALITDLFHFLPGISAIAEGDFVSAPSIALWEIRRSVSDVIRFFGQSIRYLGPLRADPAAAQGYAPSDEPDDIGSRGEYAAARYESSQHTQIRFIDPLDDQEKTDTLGVAIDRWTSYLGVAHHVATLDAKTSVLWQIQSSSGANQRPLGDVGVGVSQVLPVLVGGLLAPPGTTFIMEQPELHLHARAQARLGDFFYAMSRLGKQCLLETHSDTLIKQLRYRLVRDGEPARQAIAIYFIEQDESGASRVQPIEISPNGNILNWPDGFCDEAIQQEDRIVEASLRRRAGTSGP